MKEIIMNANWDELLNLPDELFENRENPIYIQKVKNGEYKDQNLIIVQIPDEATDWWVDEIDDFGEMIPTLFYEINGETFICDDFEDEDDWDW